MHIWLNHFKVFGSRTGIHLYIISTTDSYPGSENKNRSRIYTLDKDFGSRIGIHLYIISTTDSYPGSENKNRGRRLYDGTGGRTVNGRPSASRRPSADSALYILFLKQFYFGSRIGIHWVVLIPINSYPGSENKVSAENIYVRQRFRIPDRNTLGSINTN